VGHCRALVSNFLSESDEFSELCAVTLMGVSAIARSGTGGVKATPFFGSGQVTVLSSTVTPPNRNFQSQCLAKLKLNAFTNAALAVQPKTG
jgi:hypothetical protein